METILQSLAGARVELETRLTNTSDTALHQAVAQDKWSPAQIADHLVLTNELFARSMQNAARGQEPITMLKGRVREDGRAVAPAEEEPRGGRSRQTLMEDLEATFTRLIEAALQLEQMGKLEHICIHQGFFGPMTGVEAMRLMAWHTRHHARQIPA